MKHIKFLNWISTPKNTWVIIPIVITWIILGACLPNWFTCFKTIPITEDGIKKLIEDRISNSIAFLGIPMAIMGFIMAIIAMKENVILTLIFEFTRYYTIIYLSISIILGFLGLSFLKANFGNNDWLINATLSLNYLFFLNFLSVFHLITQISKMTSIKNLIELVERKMIKQEKKETNYIDFYIQQLIKKANEKDYYTIPILLNSLARIYNKIGFVRFGEFIETINNLEEKAVESKDFDLIKELLKFYNKIDLKDNFIEIKELPINLYNISHRTYSNDDRFDLYHKKITTKILENLHKQYIDKILKNNVFCRSYTSLTDTFIKHNDAFALEKAINELFSIYKSIVNKETNKKEDEIRRRKESIKTAEQQSISFKNKIPYRILDIRYSIVDLLKDDVIQKDDAIKLYKVTQKDYNKTNSNIESDNIKNVINHFKITHNSGKTENVTHLGFVIELINDFTTELEQENESYSININENKHAIYNELKRLSEENLIKNFDKWKEFIDIENLTLVSLKTRLDKILKKLQSDLQ